MASPFNNKTPESYFAGLRRKDSKNALTTCHGVTDKGRACRRALASPKNSSRYEGAVVLTDNVEDPAVFFCWQHKDQADLFDAGVEGSVVSLKGRNSLEDAFRSLGLDNVNEEQEPASKEPSPSPATPPHIAIPEPARTVANEDQAYHKGHQGYSYERHRQRRRRDDYKRPSGTAGGGPRRHRSEGTQARSSAKSPFSFFASCFGVEPGPRQDREKTREQDHVSRPVVRSNHQTPLRVTPQLEPARVSPKTPMGIRRKEAPSHRKTDSGFALGMSDSRKPSEPNSHNTATRRLAVPASSQGRLYVYRDLSPTPAPRKAYEQMGDPKSDSLLTVHGDRPLKPRSKSTPDEQVFQRLHGEWPPPLPPNPTDTMRIIYAKLLTAMSEPPSKTDSPGYIYIFWQTDVEQSEDETSAAASIISAPTLDRGLRRQETILQRRFFQTSANAQLPTNEKRTLFLKIGRAVNVHQRLNQWKKQCEYDISLLRSYPYNSKGRNMAKQVPNVVKIERLIHLHLEMLGQRVSKQCRCGTEHKEWFEVEANAGAVRAVDEVIRRWVRWSEDRFR